MKKLAARTLASILASYVAYVRKHKDVILVAVTGSVGKTSARLAIAKLLGAQIKVPPIVEHSYNVPVATEMSFFGLSLPSPVWNPFAWVFALMRVHHLSRHFPYKAVILEVNEDEFEKMEYFFEKVPVDIAVITAITPTHMERYAGIEELTEKVLKIRNYASHTIFNADSLPLARLSRKPHTSSYGLTKQAEVMFSDVRRQDTQNLSAKLVLNDHAAVVVTRQVAKTSLYSLLAAASVASRLKLEFDDIVEGISKITPTRGRMNLLAGKKNSVILDDSYNSSPAAVVTALETLAEIKATRRIAVLGSMNELGDYAKKAHQDVAKAAVGKVDILVVIGKLAEQWLAPAALRAGFEQSNVKIFDNPFEAGHYLDSIVREGDVVLVKGSQNGVFSEEVSRILLAPSIKPEDVLVRQSSYWKKAKKRAFGVG